MKRIDGIWAPLTSFENLLRAYHKARRGKRGRPGVAEFGLNLERELLALQRALHDGTYHRATTASSRSTSASPASSPLRRFAIGSCTTR